MFPNPVLYFNILLRASNTDSEICVEALSLASQGQTLGLLASVSSHDTDD